MTCKDCEQYNKCEINPAEDEFICNDFKAKKKTKLKKILTIAGIAAGTGIITGVLAYLKGKNDGFDKALTSPEVKLITNMKTYDAVSDYNEKTLYMAENGNFATEFLNEDTGEKKYLLYSVSSEAPEWWDKEDTQKFNLREVVVNELESEEDSCL